MPGHSGGTQHQAWLYDGGVKEANPRLPDIPERTFEGRRISC